MKVTIGAQIKMSTNELVLVELKQDLVMLVAANMEKVATTKIMNLTNTMTGAQIKMSTNELVLVELKQDLVMLVAANMEKVVIIKTMNLQLH
jgi:hypothetical protein